MAVASSTDMSYEMGDYGLEPKSKASDILFGIKAGEKHFGADVAFSGPALLAFAESYLKGELTEYVRPPPPPYEPPSGDDDEYGGDEGEGDDDDEGADDKEEM